MTPTDRRHWLTVLGWEQREYARRIGWDEGTVRQWCRGTRDAPGEVDAWLAMVGAFYEAHPPPPRSSFPRKGPHVSNPKAGERPKQPPSRPASVDRP